MISIFFVVDKLTLIINTAVSATQHAMAYLHSKAKVIKFSVVGTWMH